MTAILHLARHGSHAEVGRVLSGRSAIALSDAGRAEAALLADRLAGEPLHAILSSPRARTLETAGVVAARHGLTVETMAALDEIDFGDWTGLSFDALATDPRWQAWNHARGRAHVPGGETMAEAVARIRSVADAIDKGAVLCVSHCDLIRGFVAETLGLDMDRLLDFDCDPGSLTTFVRQGKGWRLATLNERPR